MHKAFIISGFGKCCILITFPSKLICKASNSNKLTYSIVLKKALSNILRIRFINE